MSATVAAGRYGFWDGVRTGVRGFAQALITAGMIIVLFVVYELWWTGVTTKHDQRALLKTLEQRWAAVPTPPAAPLRRGTRRAVNVPGPALGTGIAVLRIPRLGKHYAFVIVQGTSTADLIKGPGHYVGSAGPGQIGNFAVAGHRTTYLHPFYDINELRPGDPIVIETRFKWFTYTVENIPETRASYQEIVPPSDVSVAYPVPDQPNPATVPTQRVLTLTSCNPRYSAQQRIVVHALLTSLKLKSAGLPGALRAEGLN